MFFDNTFIKPKFLDCYKIFTKKKDLLDQFNNNDIIKFKLKRKKN